MNQQPLSAKGSKSQAPDIVAKFALGVALLILGSLLLIGKFQPPQAVVSSSFESEPVKIEGLNTAFVEDQFLPQRIIMPELKIDLPVKNAKIVNGFWEVSSDSANWGEGSGIPGENGNQVIFAHAREGLFLPLKNATVGSRVYVLTQENWFTYEIKELKEVNPDQIEVIAATQDETLTLYTCSGIKDTKRMIVVAKRV